MRPPIEREKVPFIVEPQVATCLETTPASSQARGSFGTAFSKLPRSSSFAPLIESALSGADNRGVDRTPAVRCPSAPTHVTAQSNGCLIRMAPRSLPLAGAGGLARMILITPAGPRPQGMPNSAGFLCGWMKLHSFRF